MRHGIARFPRLYILFSCFLVTVLWGGFWPSPGQAAEVTAEITLEAETAVLMEASTGKILYEQNSHQKMAPASVTKLMTLVVAFEALEAGRGELSDRVIASAEASSLGGSQIYLEPGEEMTLEELLIAIAVGSANDACVAVAEHLYGSHEIFVEAMNKKATALGLENTHFVNTYGLPAEGHYTTAYDMAIIGRHALRFPKLRAMTVIKEYDLREGAFHLYNTNKLLWWYPGVDGFKTGWTNEARYCLASTGERDGLRLIATVFGAPQKHGNFRDTMKLFNYGFAQYVYKTVAEVGQTCGSVKVGKGAVDYVEVGVAQTAGALMFRGQDKGVTSFMELATTVSAPIAQGQKLGELVVCLEDVELARFDLVAQQEIPRGTLGKQMEKVFIELIQFENPPLRYKS